MRQPTGPLRKTYLQLLNMTPEQLRACLLHNIGHIQSIFAAGYTGAPGLDYPEATAEHAAYQAGEHRRRMDEQRQSRGSYHGK